MPEDDWISKFRINGKLVVHVLITSLMLWKNLWLRTRTGSFEEKSNICLVERTTYQVHCVLIFKCSHPVSQMSTKSMWEWTHMLLHHTSYDPQSQHKLRQAIIFSLYWHKRSFAFTSLYLFYICHIYTAGSCWTLAVPATSAAGPPPLPLLLSRLGVASQKHGQACKNTHYVSFLS